MAQTLRVKKGDTVRVTTGQLKGKEGKVVSTDAVLGTVKIEGLGIVKRHVKPSRVNPRGGEKEIHKSLPISNVVLLDSESGKHTRVSYSVSNDGTKVRIATNLKRKEIK